MNYDRAKKKWRHLFFKQDTFIYKKMYSCTKVKGYTLVHKEFTRFKLGVH